MRLKTKYFKMQSTTTKEILNSLGYSETRERRDLSILLSRQQILLFRGRTLKKFKNDRTGKEFYRIKYSSNANASKLTREQALGRFDCFQNCVKEILSIVSINGSSISVGDYSLRLSTFVAMLYETCFPVKDSSLSKFGMDRSLHTIILYTDTGAEKVTINGFGVHRDTEVYNLGYELYNCRLIPSIANIKKWKEIWMNNITDFFSGRDHYRDRFNELWRA